MPVSIFDECVSAIHHLSAAAWFGALVYRAFFVEPKAMRFFRAGADYERFSLELAHGMRYVVMFALATCGLTDFILFGLKWNPSEGWLALIAGKTGLWIVASALFAYISWVYWPRRVFALKSEWPRVRRQGFILAVAGRVTDYYVAIELANGGKDFETFTYEEAVEFRDRFASTRNAPDSVKKWSPWYDQATTLGWNGFDWMAVKTLIKRIGKRLPLSVEFATVAPGRRRG